MQDLYDDGITEGKKLGREEGKILAFSEIVYQLEKATASSTETNENWENEK